MTAELAQLERLASAFPLEKVSIEINHRPGHKPEIVAWLKGSEVMLTGVYECRSGDTAAEAVDMVIKSFKDKRSLDNLREVKIAELLKRVEDLRRL
jgi:hypothetical protein